MMQQAHLTQAYGIGKMPPYLAELLKGAPGLGRRMARFRRLWPRRPRLSRRERKRALLRLERLAEGPVSSGDAARVLANPGMALALGRWSPERWAEAEDWGQVRALGRAIDAVMEGRRPLSEVYPTRTQRHPAE